MATSTQLLHESRSLASSYPHHDYELQHLQLQFNASSPTSYASTSSSTEPNTTLPPSVSSFLIGTSPVLFRTVHDASKTLQEGLPTYLPFQGLNRTFRLGTHSFAIFSPEDTSTCIVTYMAVIVPMVLYYCSIASLWLSSVWLWITVWLHITCCIAFLKTTFTDPGILPRYTHVHIDDNRCVDNDPIDVMIHGHPSELKYCYTCKLYRPPRAFHCPTCDNCVANHDHHCPWVANCVGLGNYRYFVTLISNASVLVLLVLIQCFMFALDTPLPILDHLQLHPLVFILLCASAVLAIFLWPLAGFHWYLMLHNWTTHEQVKFGRSALWHSPFNRNPWKNITWTLFRPFSPSMLQRYRKQSHDFGTVRTNFFNEV